MSARSKSPSVILSGRMYQYWFYSGGDTVTPYTDGNPGILYEIAPDSKVSPLKWGLIAMYYQEKYLNRVRVVTSKTYTIDNKWVIKVDAVFLDRYNQ